MAGYLYRFSIFTATYNRGNLLKGLYECIKSQDYKGSYEWVIVSDGSTDDTDKVVQQFIDERLVDINYIKIPHGGKHMAWRAAADQFNGRYIITADDDDPIPTDMLSIYDRYWTELESSPEYDSFWEIKSRAQNEDGRLVGVPLPLPYYDSDYIQVTFIQRRGAEMDGCRKVEVLRKEASVPEKFWYEDKCTNFPEGVRWARAAKKYKTRFVPEITRVYIVGHESLCTAIGKKRSSQRNYNSLVSSLYAINEWGDILIKHDIKEYLKTTFHLTYSTIRLRETVLSKITHLRDKLAYIIFYTPALLLFKFRRY